MSPGNKTLPDLALEWSIIICGWKSMVSESFQVAKHATQFTSVPFY